MPFQTVEDTETELAGIQVTLIRLGELQKDAFEISKALTPGTEAETAANGLVLMIQDECRHHQARRDHLRGVLVRIKREGQS